MLYTLISSQRGDSDIFTPTLLFATSHVPCTDEPLLDPDHFDYFNTNKKPPDPFLPFYPRLAGHFETRRLNRWRPSSLCGKNSLCQRRVYWYEHLCSMPMFRQRQSVNNTVQRFTTRQTVGTVPLCPSTTPNFYCTLFPNYRHFFPLQPTPFLQSYQHKASHY